MVKTLKPRALVPSIPSPAAATFPTIYIGILPDPANHQLPSRSTYQASPFFPLLSVPNQPRRARDLKIPLGLPTSSSYQITMPSRELPSPSIQPSRRTPPWTPGTISPMPPPLLLSLVLCRYFKTCAAAIFAGSTTELIAGLPGLVRHRIQTPHGRIHSFPSFPALPHRRRCRIPFAGAAVPSRAATVFTAASLGLLCGGEARVAASQGRLRAHGPRQGLATGPLLVFPCRPPSPSNRPKATVSSAPSPSSFGPFHNFFCLANLAIFQGTTVFLQKGP